VVTLLCPFSVIFLVSILLVQPSKETVLYHQDNPELEYLLAVVSDTQDYESMVFVTSRFDRIPRDLFRNFAALTTLGVSSCEIRELPSFQHSNVLKFADFSNNRIQAVREDVFTGCHHLEVLDLAGNEISGIHRYAFYGLEKLQDLDLSLNRVTNLDRMVLERLIQLEKLNLRSNQLQVLDTNIFSKTHGLKILNVEDNAIDQIVPPADRTIGLTHLYMRKNRLAEMKEVSTAFGSLQYLDLSDNPDLKVGPDSFGMLDRLEYLGLDGVDLAENLHTLQPLVYLVELSVAHVGLNSNFVGHLPHLGRLERFNVENNDLNKLDYASLKVSLPALRLIGLDSNGFTCSYLEEVVQHLENQGVFMDFWRMDAGGKAGEVINGVNCTPRWHSRRMWLIITTTFFMSLFFFLGFGVWYYYRSILKQLRGNATYNPVARASNYYENPNFVE
jgi:Leucine-rich repeat (LRR) protein